MQKINYLKLLLYFFIFSFILSLSKDFFITSVHAADFRTSYAIDYYIQEDDRQGYTKAAYTITLTNLKPDLIVKKYTISFPRSFSIGNMVAKDARGGLATEIVEKERTTEVTFELNDPKPGLNEVNTLYLDFLQKNIFRSKGSIWEVFIPTLENKEGDAHTVTVYLPPGQHRKLSLSKPTPTNVSFDKVTWNGDMGRSIYAVFGEEQRYNLNLTYHLVNPNIYKVYTDVAFPPDTVYQKTIVESIIPPPDMVYSDSDGNYMARYNLESKAEKQIQFKGITSIYATPRRDYKEFARKQFESQQRTLFDVQPLWKLDNETPITTSDVKAHYDYTTKTLSYNFNRIIKGNSRMGAGEALRFPDQAVCTEYSDLLIASARQRGIYMREVQGFAFANEQELRPVQTESDILHSWVEYYDVKKNNWVPIDPTWEDTSGIDYFSSFDFNHIVFALHGKKADYPYPAGSYKAKLGGQDIRIEPTTKILAEIKKLSAKLTLPPLPYGETQFSVDLTIKNEGNVAQWNIPLTITAKNAHVNSQKIEVQHLYPGETKKIAVTFTPQTSLLYQNVTFTVTHNANELLNQEVQVPTILSSAKKYALPIGLIVGGGILLVLILRKRNE